MREVYQLKKSEAIMKFETVMSNMLKKQLAKATLKSLHACKKPLFNKHYGNNLDQLTSYYQAEINDNSNSRITNSKEGCSSGKLVFMPTLAETINRNVTENYNAEAVSHAKHVKKERNKEIISSINTLVKRSSTFSILINSNRSKNHSDQDNSKSSSRSSTKVP